MSHRRKLLAFAAALAAAVPVTYVAVTSADAAVTGNTIPITITNNSGRNEPVYLYNLGTLLTTGQQGWADAGGNFHAWGVGGNPPTPAPDASIPGPANGQSLTIQLPKFSGRVYFSYGQKLDFRLTTGGLVQPAVQNPADPNRNILFNWTEYTLNNDGIWINSTQVDFFSAPYAVNVQTGAGSTLTTGHLKTDGFNNFFNALRAAPGGYGGLIQTRPDGTVLRALNPGHGIGAGLISATVMQDYIDRVWARYSTSALTVQPFSDQPGTVYTGRVSGNVMNFTNSSGAVVTSFQKPDSDSVFGCYKLLDAPNDLVRGPISRTLCAGFNRTTLLTSATQPYNVPSAFYQDGVTNQYAKAVHAQMADGKAYAFAFDDVGANESLVHDGSPQRAGIILDPFTGTPSNPPTSTPPSSTPPTSTPPNCTLLSQGRPATASSTEAGYPANLAVDGNATTRWSSAFSDPQWLQVDLGSTQSIGRVDLSWEAAYGRAYRIETSTNGTTWTPYGSSVTAGDGGSDSISGTGSGRYVRMYGTQRATAYGYSLFEFKVYAAGCGTTTPPGPFAATQYLQSAGTLTAATGAAGSLSLVAANGNHDGTPTNARTFTATGLNAHYTGAATAYNLAVDSAGVGNGTQVRVSYDLTGNGSWDRVETYRYFPTDPVAGMEQYTQAQGLSSATGALGDLANGRVQVEVWSAIGSSANSVGVGNQSRVILPFS